MNSELLGRFVLDLEGDTAEDLKVTEMYGDDLGGVGKVAPEQYAWPAYGGMAMGWSWALWARRGALATVMTEAALASDEWLLD